MKLVWDESAWEDYQWWQGQDRKTLKRINTLSKDIARNSNEHRIVYKIADDQIRGAAWRYHYEG